MELTIIGLLIIVVIVALLMSGKTSPIVAMAVVPLVGALIAGFSLAEISGFFEAGLTRVVRVAAMFLFAILFFSILKELHVFDPMIKAMLAATGGNVIVVAVMTALIAALVHLDGSGATSFLIVIPALLPLYKRLGMSPYLMLLLMAGSMGVMNMVPWGGPLGRAAAVTGLDASTLWQSLIPVQIIGVIGMVGVAVVMGLREQRRIAAAKALGTTPFEQDCMLKEIGEESNQHVQPKNFFFNISLVIIAIVLLATGWLSAAYVFMLALSATLVVNFRTPKQQMDVVARHAPQALSMGRLFLPLAHFWACCLSRACSRPLRLI